MKKRIDYYRRFATCGEVRLIGSSEATERDGDYAHFREIASTLAIPGPT